jgi:hypothetical protein
VQGYNRGVKRIATRHKLRLAILLPLIFAPLAFPQASIVGPSCDLKVLGGTQAKDFLAFDRDLRGALSTQDAGKVALLVNFPLRVNDDRGSYYIQDAQSLQGRFNEIFPDTVRKTVLNEKPEAIECTWWGIMYGNGEVWVHSANGRYGIASVSLPDAGQLFRPSKPGGVQFACRTAKSRAIVDIGPDGTPHYRGWNATTSLTEKPDIDIPKGTATLEGTGSCAHRTWTFKGPTLKVVIEELGCMPDSNQPPQGAVGILDVSPIPPPPDAYITPWCF